MQQPLSHPIHIDLSCILYRHMLTENEKVRALGTKMHVWATPHLSQQLSLHNPQNESIPTTVKKICARVFWIDCFFVRKMAICINLFGW